jgi:translocation and assembly module TamA
LLPLSGAARTQDSLRLIVDIRGLNDEAAQNVRLHIGLQPDDPPRSEAHLGRLYRDAPNQIREALQALGYYQAGITSDLQQRDNVWHATFAVNPGAPVRIVRLDLRIDLVDGDRDPVLTGLIDAFPLKRNDVLNHGLYEQGKRRWRSMAAERGYFDSRLVKHEVLVDAGNNTAVVTLHLAAGPRYRLGQVRFIQDDFDSGYLHRLIPFKAGAAYHDDDIAALRTALENSDHFNSVDVEVMREQVENHVLPVEVRLGVRPKHKLTAGAGFGTDTGARLNLGWENRRINRSGHRLRTEIALTQISTGLGAVYEIPLENPLREKLEFTASWLDESNDTADSTISLVGARRTKVRGNWLETVYLNLLNESYSVGTDAGSATLLLPGINWARTRTDDRFTPRRGDRVTLELKGTDTFLGSDTRFVQARLTGKLVRSLGERDRLLMRGEVGASVVGDFSELPASQRFYAGGDQSVRGYDYNSLGPLDANGDVTGGRHLMVGSLEYERRFFKKWGVAAFYDIGNAMNGFGDDLKHGAGIGLRWLTPIGPIRADLAVALDDPGGAIRLHLYLGPDL